jgi:hypothetical protein
MWWRFWRRPRAEKWLALESVAVCFLSVVALRVVGFERWKMLLATSSPGASLTLEASACDKAAIEEVYASVVDMVACNTWGLVTFFRDRLPYGGCSDDGVIRSELWLGVREDGEHTLAHAWVGCHGEMIGEPSLSGSRRFEMVPLVSWPGGVLE